MTTRRSFLKAAAVAAATVQFVPRHVLGAPAPSPNSKLRIA